MIAISFLGYCITRITGLFQTTLKYFNLKQPKGWKTLYVSSSIRRNVK